MSVAVEQLKASGPTINRGGSVQEVATPWEFIAAVNDRFGEIAWDLAATLLNSKAVNAGLHFSPADDSLARDWHKIDGLLWLNPPYSNITPWATKCAEEMRLGAEILLLVPGSIGANWYWDHVDGVAQVYSVGRIKFVGHKDQYPKDLILAHYIPDQKPKPMQRWRWKA